MTDQVPGEIVLGSDSAAVQFTRTLACRRGLAWSALVDPTQLSLWMDDASVERRVGGVIEIRFDDGPVRCVITDLVDGAELAYSWRAGEPNESHVRYELTDTSNGETQLVMTHSGVPPSAAAAYAAGWHQHLDQLGTMLAGGAGRWSDDRFAELRGMYAEMLE